MGAGAAREHARLDLLLVGQMAGLEDDLHDRAAAAGLDYAGDVAFRGGVVAGTERARVEHHVELDGAVLHRADRLVDLGLGAVGAERESDHGAHPDRRFGQLFVGERDPVRVDAHAGETVLARLVAERLDVGTGRGRSEERVIDHAREHVIASADSRARGHPLDTALDQAPDLIGAVRDAVRAVAIGAALAGDAVVMAIVMRQVGDAVTRGGLALELVGDQVGEAVEL